LVQLGDEAADEVGGDGLVGFSACHVGEREIERREEARERAFAAGRRRREERRARGRFLE
jgi:hypothetical protein